MPNHFCFLISLLQKDCLKSDQVNQILLISVAGTIVSRGDWLGNPANFKGTFCCFGFDVETYHHVTMTLHSLFQSKMADGAVFLNGDDLEAILDILEADKEMEEEFINEDENVSTRNTIITLPKLTS